MSSLPTSSLDPARKGRVKVMGILNVTPDSFSDGGLYLSEQEINNRIKEMISTGADIIDVGGESTRPFAESVSLDEELQRIIPAIKIIRLINDSIPISIDTTKAEVARQAIKAGATIVNDISALRFDPAMVEVVRENKVPVIIMHMQGTPGDMQNSPTYDDVIMDIKSFLTERISWAITQGISPSKIIIDPGLGFGKTVAHNLSILKNLPKLQKLGYPVIIGHSRKSFISKIIAPKGDEDRDTATAAISALCAAQNVSILRVHDVKKTVQAVRLAEAIQNAP
ncbi:MAG: dihydropteroate synthase [Proteobacteria bacterium]|nr:dihydropteroate synthase [Pseudomonadota bacterium]MBU1715857.1 dihydropteroate synthase [Pseudomonadota bacterium]